MFNLTEKLLNNLEEKIIYLDNEMQLIWSNQKSDEKYCYQQWGFEGICKDCPVVEAKEKKQVIQRIMVKPNSQIYLVKAIPDLDENGDVKGFYEVSLNITEIKEKEEKLDYIRHNDQLTGLFNFPYFKEIMKEFDEQKKVPVGIMIVDIKRLNSINTEFGYDTGNKIITNISAILIKSAPANAVISRTAGGEFIILLPASGQEAIDSTYEKIHWYLNNSEDRNIITVKIGSTVKVNPDKSIAELIAKADKNSITLKPAAKEVK
ncbi:MAG: diguanylate cyclase domain-containing protein [Bacillota bacterium]